MVNVPRAALSIPILIALSTGCREKADNAAPAASVSADLAKPALPSLSRAVSGEASFDLFVLSDGAALALGDRNGGISVVVFDRAGVQRGEPIVVPQTSGDHVVELAGAAAGTRVALGWVARTKSGEAASWAALGDTATRTFAAPVPLGRTTVEGVAQGGYVDIAASPDGSFVAVRRGEDEPCANDSERRCAAYGFRELTATGTEPRGLPMSVPAPCTRGLAGFVSVEDRWHFGFCSQAEGRAVTTHFMRQLTPFYVEVHRSGEGCTPLGASFLGTDALFVADCPSGRRAARVGAMRESLRSVDLSRTVVSCEHGRPVFRSSGEGALELRLDAPRDRLGSLLPHKLSGTNARAAWTGASLLSAAWLGGEVSLRRHVCRGSELVGS